MFFIYGLLTTFLITFLHFGLVNILGLKNFWITFIWLAVITAMVEIILFSLFLEVIKKRPRKVKNNLLVSCIAASIFILLKLEYDQNSYTWGMIDISMGIFIFFTIPCLVIKNIVDFRLLNKKKSRN